MVPPSKVRSAEKSLPVQGMIGVEGRVELDP